MSLADFPDMMFLLIVYIYMLACITYSGSSRAISLPQYQKVNIPATDV